MLIMLIDEEVFVGFRGDDFGPAEDFSLFEEILCVLAGMFDLVKIGLSDGEWTVRGILHRWKMGWKSWFRGSRRGFQQGDGFSR